MADETGVCNKPAPFIAPIGLTLATSSDSMACKIIPAQAPPLRCGKTSSLRMVVDEAEHLPAQSTCQRRFTPTAVRRRVHSTSSPECAEAREARTRIPQAGTRYNCDRDWRNRSHAARTSGPLLAFIPASMDCARVSNSALGGKASVTVRSLS
jgi:hypothetical protein